MKIEEMKIDKIIAQQETTQEKGELHIDTCQMFHNSLQRLKRIPKLE